jgi:Xaa-Pro aminopeptidase
LSLFERNEYLGRLARTRARMRAAGVDVLLVASPENINYLCGYAGWSFYVPQILAVAMDDEEPTLIVREMDVACAEFSVFLRPEQQIGYPERYIGSESLHPMEFIADHIRARGWHRLRLGVEKDAHFFSVRSFETLQARLPEATFVDADLLVDWVRTVKSDAEMVLMRQAGVIVDRAMQAAIDAIRPGVRECDAVAAQYHAQLAGTPEFGGGVPNSVIILAGERVGAPHLRWTDEPYREGDTVTLEFSGCRHQYHVALARTVVLGPPPPVLLKLRDVIVEGIGAALEVVRPGTLCEEVEAAFRRSTLKHGYEKKARIGYAQGLCFQPTWIERTMSFQRGDRTPLEPNMVFHLHAGMWDGRRTLVITESIAVTATGYELLTHFPRELFVRS